MLSLVKTGIYCHVLYCTIIGFAFQAMISHINDFVIILLYSTASLRYSKQVYVYFIHQSGKSINVVSFVIDTHLHHNLSRFLGNT